MTRERAACLAVGLVALAVAAFDLYLIVGLVARSFGWPPASPS